MQLERIANALELIVEKLDTKENGELYNFPQNIEANFYTSNPKTLEEELIIRTADIYLAETIRKTEMNLQRKSAVKVSQDLIQMQIAFLKNQLQGYNVVVHQKGLLAILSDTKPVALVRFYTDLGFHRGSNWKNDIENAINEAKSLNIETRNIFMIVLSNTNGLDNEHVNSLLHKDISNKEILEPEYLDDLKKYCILYIDSFKILLPEPRQQLFFLTSSLHPNKISNQIIENPESKIDLLGNNWISKPLKSIIENILRI